MNASKKELDKETFQKIKDLHERNPRMKICTDTLDQIIFAITSINSLVGGRTESVRENFAKKHQKNFVDLFVKKKEYDSCIFPLSYDKFKSSYEALALSKSCQKWVEEGADALTERVKKFKAKNHYRWNKIEEWDHGEHLWKDYPVKEKKMPLSGTLSSADDEGESGKIRKLFIFYGTHIKFIRGYLISWTPIHPKSLELLLRQMFIKLWTPTKIKGRNPLWRKRELLFLQMFK